MNLHVTNDHYGLYPVEIAKRIKSSGHQANNIMINLGEDSQIKDEFITYISLSKSSFQSYIDTLNCVSKIIFHPYTYKSYQFLKILKKKYPEIKVYWVCWSGELYGTHIGENLYEPFSLQYVAKKAGYHYFKNKIKNIVKLVLQTLRVYKSYSQKLIESYSLVDYFCALLPSDHEYLNKIKGNNPIKYLPLVYLTFEQIIPDFNQLKSVGDQIMIGHSASPGGNQYEIIQKLSLINSNFSIFLPLAYGDQHYASLIKNEAAKRFNNLEVLEHKLEAKYYYKKLTNVGWAVFNVKVQEGIGNIMVLLWMGIKVFLDKNTSTYKDFKNWGLVLFNIQDDLNENCLTTKLNAEQVEKNKKIIYERFGEGRVSSEWKEILT